MALAGLGTVLGNILDPLLVSGILLPHSGLYSSTIRCIMTMHFSHRFNSKKSLVTEKFVLSRLEFFFPSAVFELEIPL